MLAVFGKAITTNDISCPLWLLRWPPGSQVPVTSVIFPAYARRVMLIVIFITEPCHGTVSSVFVERPATRMLSRQSTGTLCSIFPQVGM